MTGNEFESYGGEGKAEAMLQFSIRGWFAKTRSRTAAERVVAITKLVEAIRVGPIERPHSSLPIVARKLRYLIGNDRSKKVRKVATELASNWMSEVDSINTLFRDISE